MTYIESEFALLEAQNEQLTRENKTLAEALEAVQGLYDLIYNEGIVSEADLSMVHRRIEQALAKAGKEECTCLPDLPDGRVNGGRGGCCPVCEDEIYIGGE